MDSLRVHDYGRPEVPEEFRESAIDTDQLREQYEVESFLAPYIICRRKSDGAWGVMEFTHDPRWYFNFIERGR